MDAKKSHTNLDTVHNKVSSIICPTLCDYKATMLWTQKLINLTCASLFNVFVFKVTQIWILSLTKCLQLYVQDYVTERTQCYGRKNKSH